MNGYLAGSRSCDQTREPICHARHSRHRSYRPRSLCLAADRRGNPVLADRLQCRQYAQPVRGVGCRIPLPDHRTGAGADPPHAAEPRRSRYLADHPDPDHHVHPAGHHLLHLSQRILTRAWMLDPWRYSGHGISVALRVTPRGGRDAFDGLETLANGRTVVKMRVRAIAEGGEANRAVVELLARALGVPKARVRVLSGTTSRLKQIAVDGDPAKLGDTLRMLTATKPD